jgi:uncharacterized protein YbjT (DUF2867 family)
VAVRALIHDEAKADVVRELGAEPVVAEMGDPKTLEPALAGVERAYLVSPVSPMQAEYEQVFVETAKAAGVQHVVKLSVIGASGESPLRFARNHAVVEQALRDSGLAWTFLRPNSFMQNNLAWAPRVQDGTFYSPVPDAAFSIVDARDVAEVAVAALTGDDHAGKAYALTGPEAVSYRDQARRLFAAAGREVAVEEVDAEAVKQALVQAGVPPWNAEGLAEQWQMYASGGAALVASGVEDVLGRPPRDLDAFARDHAEAFRAG